MTSATNIESRAGDSNCRYYILFINNILFFKKWVMHIFKEMKITDKLIIYIYILFIDYKGPDKN